jgi:ActR/RegA family two-component response regulator
MLAPRAIVVVVLDPGSGCPDPLAAQLMQMGSELHEARGTVAAKTLITRTRAGLVLCEDNLYRPWVPILEWLAEERIDTKVAIATKYASISSAVRAMKMGAAIYLQRPVSATQLLTALDRADPGRFETIPAPERPSLHRVRWERINSALDAAGSVAGAAQLLGLDRRSLRRMLNSYPPAR